MLKHSILVLIFLLFPGFAIAIAQINIGVHPDFRPLEFDSNNAGPQGALIDYWKLWGKKNDTEITFIRLSNSNLETALHNGDIDLVANAPGLPNLTYSDSYLTYDYYLFSFKKLHIENADQFPLRIGVRQADAAFVKEELLATADISFYSDHHEMLNSLKSEEIDFFIANDVNLNFAIKTTDLLKLHYPFQPFYSHSVQAGTLEHNIDLLVHLNKGMTGITEQEYKAIIAKWYPSMVGYRFSWPLIGLAIVVFMSVIITMIVWMMNIKLKIQVDVATQSLIAEKEALNKANQQLELLANNDALTGLANRRHLQTVAQTLMSLSGRNGQPLSLMVCDMDKFKEVNDTHGHDMGDRAICHIADCLRKAVREIDIVARFGGDEFVLLLPGITSDEALAVATRLRNLIANTPIFSTNGERLSLTLSCGIAQREPNDRLLEDLFQRADARLFSAKQNGRDQTVANNGDVF